MKKEAYLIVGNTGYVGHTNILPAITRARDNNMWSL